ncbi:protein ANTAGONIST OF LIKE HETEROCHROMATIN PROTEIN 1-like [Stegodyphus dumicola]|uniref:protein ANTAGONIST OF LIKE HETEROCHROMATIN PROTEIN 1-like n=1 Tax=Stegodyphus dumicola TaxID=202533 RepID=UPI0015B1860B|nr:protein ANTAGONIST OF LIKE HETEROCHROMATIN PROTEIN 1-like [Stegodyphus dumicola]
MRLQDTESFFNFFRMTPQKFDELLSVVGPRITMKATSFRNPISAQERLAITIRFLASGDSMTNISYLFRVGKPTVSKIVRQVCDAIWVNLSPVVLKPPTTEKWRKIATIINNEWEFPNCIGAVDGKHIVMQAPNSSGSAFFNYKGSFSIVLLAACDGKYCFTIVDIGGSGRQSDGGIFHSSTFGQALKESLNIPKPEAVCPGKYLPYVFVADEAFPLKKNLMRPFPGRNLDTPKKIYNYRLSRCRRLIENTFGIFASRFRIFRKPIIGKTETVESIAKAAVCLHNYLKICDDMLPIAKRKYCPFGFADFEDHEGTFHDGQWRSYGTGNMYAKEPFDRWRKNQR